MFSLLILPGDGIGPEVLTEVKRVISWFQHKRELEIDIEEGSVGGASYDKHGTPLTEEMLKKALEVDAVLLGAVGGPDYDNLNFDLKPERALLKLRKELDLFANIRPAQCFDALASFSSLKKEIVSGLDIVIVRELTSGIYFGEPRGIHTDGSNERVGINTQRYTESEIRRVAISAFELALKRNKKLCSMEKANVMESGVLWRDVVNEVHVDYREVELSHMYADNGAMQLVRDPKQFDVTDNLFGDILSDCAAMLTGSLGMLPSASLGNKKENGLPRAMYEPVHGSAPDISGQAKANPIACILSFSMALRYSFSDTQNANLLEQCIEKVLAKGYRTPDLMMGDQGRLCSTSEMTDKILEELEAS